MKPYRFWNVSLHPFAHWQAVPAMNRRAAVRFAKEIAHEDYPGNASFIRARKHSEFVVVEVGAERGAA